MHQIAQFFLIFIFIGDEFATMWITDRWTHFLNTDTKHYCDSHTVLCQSYRTVTFIPNCVSHTVLR